MIKRTLLVGICFQLLMASSLLANPDTSNTCFLFQDSGDAERYVLLSQNNGFYHYLDKECLKEGENYLEVRVMAIPASACNDPENKQRDIGFFAFRNNGTEGKILGLEQYQENGEQVRRMDGMFEGSEWESIPPGHPLEEIWEKIRTHLKSK